MSLLDRARRAFAVLTERRSLENPRYSLFDTELWEALGAGSAKSGVSVTTSTALQITAVLACIRVLGEGVGSLPLIVYRRRKSGGKDRATDHRNYELLHDRPTPELPSLVWREILMAHLGLRGNAYVEKELDGAGRPIALWPISPDRVSVERIRGVKVFNVDVNGQKKPLTAETIMHIPGLGYDGLVGYNPIAIARDALGLAIAAQDHGSYYFQNSAEPSGALEHPGKLSKEAAAKLKASWNAAHSGDKRNGTAVLEEGMKWQQLGVSNRDSQFLETRKFSVAEIARIYRVPPHMIGDLERATFSNIEQQSTDFVVNTLRPWLVRWEQVLNWELFSPAERREYFCEFNVDGLLRGDSAARGEFYTKMIGTGVVTINEAREKENLNPVEGGDKHFVPLNMTTLDKAGEATPKPAPAAAPAAPKPDDDAQRAVAAFTPMVRDVLERAQFRERQAATRAAKKGRASFLAWVAETEDEQVDYLARALAPIAQGVSTMLGADAPGIARRIATAEVASHSRAYRSLAEPTEELVSAIFDLTSIDDTARSITAQIIGAFALTPDERKAA
jgi:HK97 family phage portal protein